MSDTTSTTIRTATAGDLPLRKPLAIVRVDLTDALEPVTRLVYATAHKSGTPGEIIVRFADYEEGESIAVTEPITFTDDHAEIREWAEGVRYCTHEHITGITESGDVTHGDALRLLNPSAWGGPCIVCSRPESWGFCAGGGKNAVTPCAERRTANRAAASARASAKRGGNRRAKTAAKQAATADRLASLGITTDGITAA